MNGPSLATLVATGLALGWSVAWPPGPINAEITRRGLARGFLPALAVGAGATFGDGWFAVALGAEALTAAPAARDALAAASAALLALLGVVYLVAAWRAWRGLSGEAPAPARSRFESVAGGFLFGLTMALTSPWNLAFWL